MNWITPDISDGVMPGLGKVFEEAEAEFPDFFPDLRRDQELVIACDYSGEHQQSKHHVLTFLLTDRSSLREWEPERLAVRHEFLSDGRRMAFKNLSDARRQQAFFSFLQATARLNGFLLSMAIEKTVPPWILEDGLLAEKGVKASVVQKMLNVFIYGSLLIGGLSRAGQAVRWITDDDEIVSNDSTQDLACRVMMSFLLKYCPHELIGAALGIAGKFDDDRRAEDLCAVPDLVAGALSEFLSSAPDGTFNEAGLHIPKSTMYSTKAMLILGWLSTLSGPLKKASCLVIPDGHGGRNCNLFNLSAWIAVEDGGTLWTPPDKGWGKAIKGWGFGGGAIT
jgi:hypothetical protein